VRPVRCARRVWFGFGVAALSFTALACSTRVPTAIGKWTGPRVVFTPDQVARQSDWVRHFADIPAPPYWQPPEAAIIRAENALWPKLDERHRGCVRQVFGIVRAGRPVVRIQGFCCQQWYDDPWWERTVVDLLDTGTCAFGADFDADTGEPLRFNWGTPGPP
jgi:hypothetical protein